ncbi:hypothetical protein [Streptomyces sp. NPDC059708]|uniref:hypothetical protein n=1 Tax=Streptomyces sp. NPDC059708 TaxID=3346916 RepID=UPI00367B6111
MYLTRWPRTGQPARFVLVVFDLDAGSAGPAQVRVDAAALTRALAAHGIRCVPVVSGPGGGVHLWAACPEGLDPAVVTRIARAADRLYPSLDTSPLTNPTTGGVRPPGSLHRSGGYARLAEHTVEEAVALLRQGAGRAAWSSLLASLEAMTAYPALLSGSRVRAAGPGLKPVRHGGRLVPPSIAARGPVIRPVTTDGTGHVKLDRPWRPLSAKALAGLRRRPQARPGAHSTAAHAHVRTLALAGGSYEQLCQLAADEELSPALEWLRTASTPGGGRVPLTQVEADRRAERVWWLAVQDAARLPKRPADDRGTPREDTPGARASAELTARIEGAGPEYWNRPSGLSDRNALYAVAFLMEFSGAAEVSADVRRLGVLMGRAKSTAALAVSRVVLDGWLAVTSEADQGCFTARRLQLADSHQCPESPHHRCAIYETPNAPQKTPGHFGSDGTPNTPPLAEGGVSRCSNGGRQDLGVTRGPNAGDEGVTGSPNAANDDVTPSPNGQRLRRLEDRIAFQQSGLWTAVGHTVGRTLEALESGTVASRLGEATGYKARTTRRHLDVLTTAGLLRWDVDAQGARVPVRTEKTLYEAAAEYGTATRPGERAMAGYVDRVRWAWCLSEAEFCRLSAEAKRRSGPRAHAAQLVVDGCDPYARAYPRTADGDFDHATAWSIEALRTGALGIALAADALARTGRPIDPARLTPGTALSAERSDAGPVAA